jgi:hypothetical protein
MTKEEKPHFLIKNKPQKGGYHYSDILTSKILRDVCERVTGCSEYTFKFDNTGYNKGRLATIEYHGTTTYVSFSEEGKIKGRNYFFQSLTTALVRYYSDKKANKRICFYFLPLSGSIETSYFMFIYRLMATARVEFLNADNFLNQEIYPFNTVDDIIAARDKNRRHNKSNNSTYITRSSNGITQIYGKTYGASKKEAALLCIAVSHLALQIELYEICEQNLSELPKPDLKVIQSLGNIKVIPTDLTLERNEFDTNNSLRSPRFTYNLLEKLGPKKCAFCVCEIPELIEGAHIWPVVEIKKVPDLREEIKLKHATDGDNGIWLCENHHKMLDENLLRINENGKLKFKSNIEVKSVEYIRDTTPITRLTGEIFTTKFVRYLKERNKLVDDIQYNIL